MLEKTAEGSGKNKMGFAATVFINNIERGCPKRTTSNFSPHLMTNPVYNMLVHLWS